MADCGMTVADVTAQTKAWAANMATTGAAMVKAGGFSKSLMYGNFHVHQDDKVPPCVTFLRDACKANSTIATSATMFGYTQVSEVRFVSIENKPMPSGSWASPWPAWLLLQVRKVLSALTAAAWIMYVRVR